MDHAALARVDPERVRTSNRKQAMVPEGATVLDPVGTAPGLVVPPADGTRPTVVVLPGPPRELQPLWEAARNGRVPGRDRGRAKYRREMLRLYGIPESEIASDAAGRRGGRAFAGRARDHDLPAPRARSRSRPGSSPIGRVRLRGARRVRPRAPARTLFSEDGATVDQQVAELLDGRMVAVAESCTGGLMSARLTERAGSSAYFAGGLVAYSNDAKTSLVGVDGQI